MTAFVVAVMISALAWLAFEGWLWVKSGKQLMLMRQKSFAAELHERAWQQEAKRLQVLIATQQQQITHLHDELAALKAMLQALSSSQQQLEAQITAAAAPREALRNTPLRAQPEADGRILDAISPEYAEPLALARRGASAEELVERCGMSLAEAQLICALAGKCETS